MQKKTKKKYIYENNNNNLYIGKISRAPFNMLFLILNTVF